MYLKNGLCISSVLLIRIDIAVIRKVNDANTMKRVESRRESRSGKERHNDRRIWWTNRDYAKANIQEMILLFCH